MEGCIDLISHFLVEWSSAFQFLINLVYAFIVALLLMGGIAFKLGRQRAFIVSNYYVPSLDEALKKLKPKQDRIKVAIVGTAFIAACYLGLLTLASLLFPHPLAAAISQRAAQHAGIELNFKASRLSLFRKQFELKDVHLVKREHNKLAVDIRIESLKMELSISPFGPHEFKEVLIRGMGGWFEVPRLKATHAKGEPSLLIRRYRVSKSKLVFRYGPRQQVELALDDANGSDLSNDHSLFGWLFQSNVRGTLAGSKFEIRHHASIQDAVIDWEFSGLPAFWVRRLFPLAPFDWLHAAPLSVRATSRIHLNRPNRVQTLWDITMTHPSLINQRALDTDEKLLMIATKRFIEKQSDGKTRLIFRTYFEESGEEVKQRSLTQVLTGSLYEGFTNYLKKV